MTKIPFPEFDYKAGLTLSSAWPRKNDELSPELSSQIAGDLSINGVAVVRYTEDGEMVFVSNDEFFSKSDDDLSAS